MSSSGAGAVSQASLKKQRRPQQVSAPSKNVMGVKQASISHEPEQPGGTKCPDVLPHAEIPSIDLFELHKHSRSEAARLILAALDTIDIPPGFKQRLELVTLESSVSPTIAQLIGLLDAGKFDEALQLELDLDAASTTLKDEVRVRIASFWFHNEVKCGARDEATRILRVYLSPLLSPKARVEHTSAILGAPRSSPEGSTAEYDQALKGIIGDIKTLVGPKHNVPSSLLKDVIDSAARYYSTINPVIPPGSKRTLWPKFEKTKALSFKLESVIVQGIHSLGFKDLAAELGASLHVNLESPGATDLRAAILEGRWTEALSLVHPSKSSDVVVTADKIATSGPSLFDTQEAKNTAAFAILAYAMSELMSSGTIEGKMQAVALARLYSPYFGRQNEISRLLLGKDTTSGSDRRSLWTQTSLFISPESLLPDDLFIQILNYARLWKALTSPSWCGSEAQINEISFFSETSGTLDISETGRCLTLNDEIWDLDFSHDGKFLAAGSRNGELAVWNTEDLHVVTIQWPHHKKGIATLAWSPDDSMIVSGGEDGLVILWSMQTRNKIFSEKGYEHGAGSAEKAIGSVCWSSSGEYLFAGSHDGNLIMFNLKGERVWRYSGIRVRSLSVFDSGKKLAVLSIQQRLEQRLYILDLENFDSADELLLENTTVSSLAISSDSRQFLMNVIPRDVRLWDYFEHLDTPFSLYQGPIQEEEIIRSSFGGPFDKYILSGSEDGITRIYLRYGSVSSQPLLKLMGHASGVNVAKWCPHHSLIATASDDDVINLWKVSSRPN